MTRPHLVVGSVAGVGVGLVWLLSLAAPAAGQPPRSSDQVDVARLIVDARVINEDGEPMLGLELSDFEVRVGGQPARVESVQWVGGEAGTDVPILAGSLGGVLERTARGRLVVFVVQKSLDRDRLVGLLRLLQNTGRLFSALTPTDRVAVLSFDSHLKIWLDFTDDLERAQRVLADDVMFREPAALEPGSGVSLMSKLNRVSAGETYTIEDALRVLGDALESLPGSKSVVLLGHGFGEMTVTLGVFGGRPTRRYGEARDALYGARAAVFSLDVTDVDYHTFEHGLETVSAETGGLFVRTRNRVIGAIEEVTHALVGHYVLFTELPDLDAGTHRIEVELTRTDGSVFARTIYDH